MEDPRSVAGSVPGRDQGRRPALKGTFLPYNDLKGTFVSQHATEVPLSSRRKPGPFGSHEVSECATRDAGSNAAGLLRGRGWRGGRGRLGFLRRAVGVHVGDLPLVALQLSVHVELGAARGGLV